MCCSKALVSVLVIKCYRLSELTLRDDLGGAVAGPNGTFDRCRQAGICPIAGQREIAVTRARAGPAGILLGRGSKGCAPLPHDLPAWQIGRQPRNVCDLAPDGLRERVSR